MLEQDHGDQSLNLKYLISNETFPSFVNDISRSISVAKSGNISILNQFGLVSSQETKSFWLSLVFDLIILNFIWFSKFRFLNLNKFAFSLVLNHKLINMFS